MAQAASTYFGEQRRRSTRLDQVSPVIIRGVDLLGQPFEERTATQNLSFQGCRYASKHHLPKNTWITLEVPSADARKEAVCIRARVAWIQRPRTLRELFQVGVELEKGTNIWNITFPPNDWNAETHGEFSVVPLNAAGSPSRAGSEWSLEEYLRMALAHANRESASQKTPEHETDELIGQIRQEISDTSEKIAAEARATAEEIMRERTSELQKELQNSQEVSAQAFYEQWLREFERDKANTRREIATAVSEDVAAQLASFREQVKGALVSEWAEKLSRAQVELSRWESDAQALREEVRASAETTISRSDERLNEKLIEIRRELEHSLGVGTAAKTERAEVPADAMRGEFSGALERSRAEWSELLESSLDAAVQRLAERIAGTSQELLRKSEQELAERLAELQKDSGITLEASRAALDEVKGALERQISEARNSLQQIEKSAAGYSEYSRQLEAASQDSLNDLRDHLESAVAQGAAQIQKQAAELQERTVEQANILLERRQREAVLRSEQEIQEKTAVALRQAAKAAEELAAHEDQAENILRLHRERLRQASEQTEREAARHFSSKFTEWQGDVEHARDAALKQWNEELASSIVDATGQASAALREETERRLEEAAARLGHESQRTIASSQESMGGALQDFHEKLQARCTEAEANEMRKIREILVQAASEQLEAVNSEFKKAAEASASSLGETIAESTAGALADFSTAIGCEIEAGRTRMSSEAESVIQGLQTHAQTSFEQFQEQLVIHSHQTIGEASDALTHQVQDDMEKFHAEGESALQEWSARQEGLSHRILERNQAEMQSVADSTIETALGGLRERSEERVRAAARSAERAARQACADALDASARRMKEELREAAEIHPSSGPEDADEMGSHEDHPTA